MAAEALENGIKLTLDDIAKLPVRTKIEGEWLSHKWIINPHFNGDDCKNFTFAVIVYLEGQEIIATMLSSDELEVSYHGNDSQDNFHGLKLYVDYNARRVNMEVTLHDKETSQALVTTIILLCF